MALYAGASHAAETVTLSLAPEQRVCESFLGFGNEWDANGYLSYPLTEAQHAQEAARVRWMRPGIMRVMVLTRWLYDNGTYTWDSPGMQQLYRSLDLLQELGVTVFLTDWGGEKDWTRGPGIKSVEDPVYAEAMGTYLEYLVRTKGYTCIRYFICTNEPNWEVNDWARWKQGLLNVEAAIKQRGLNTQITLAGSDTSQAAEDEPWHRLAVDELQDVLGVYDIHRYASVDEVRSGTMEAYWRKQRDYAIAHDPKAASKPFLVGEAGMWTQSGNHAVSDAIDSYTYGVDMADYAVQAVSAGWTGVSAWMLSDNGHRNFAWGLWRNQEQGMTLRPWFYPWSLLCRYVRPGAAVYRVNAPENMRMLLAVSEGDWSLVCVNRGAAREVAVQAPEGLSRPVQHFRYVDGAQGSNEAGLPEPEERITLPAGGTLPISCAAESVSIFTTLN
ncbi:MAG: hypothetical protein HYV27_11515 [Candidatus Hydrogenedentes bacterium]|nr:hypothetical protein [Candidatus Hydrogenedentota bacterium]